MDEVRETLRTHARYICYTLVPLVTAEEGSQLNDRDIYFLRTILYEVNATPITLDLIRYSRIEKALTFIAMDPRWPADATSKAQKILKKWESSLGSLDDLRADLWGPRGRLEGLRKMKGLWGVTTEKAEVSTEAFSDELLAKKEKPRIPKYPGMLSGRTAFRSHMCGDTSDLPWERRFFFFSDTLLPRAHADS